VYIKLVVLLRNYVTMMHGQQNIKNGWATIVVVGRLRVNGLKVSSVNVSVLQQVAYFP
jgi:acetyl-CoA carboxylase carboxyltransferase component